MNILKKFEPTAYAALRIVFGFLFACHGARNALACLAATDHTSAGLDWSRH